MSNEVSRLSSKEFYPVMSAWKQSEDKKTFTKAYKDTAGNKRVSTIQKLDDGIYTITVVEVKQDKDVEIAKINKRGVAGILTEFFKFSDDIATQIYKPSKSPFCQPTFAF